MRTLTLTKHQHENRKQKVNSIHVCWFIQEFDMQWARNKIVNQVGRIRPSTFGCRIISKPNVGNSVAGFSVETNRIITQEQALIINRWALAGITNLWLLRTTESLYFIHVTSLFTGAKQIDGPNQQMEYAMRTRATQWRCSCLQPYPYAPIGTVFQISGRKKRRWFIPTVWLLFKLFVDVGETSGSIRFLFSIRAFHAFGDMAFQLRRSDVIGASMWFPLQSFTWLLRKHK